MTIIVEDGMGLANAESYISVASADTYHSNRGNTTWAALTTAVKEQLLRKATDYMVQTFRARWDGYRKLTTQALDWPREYVEIKDTVLRTTAYVDNASVPTIVANACAELALKANNGVLLDDQEQIVTRETIGPLTVEYDKFSGQAKRYAAIEAALSVYFKGASSSVGLVRA